MEIYETEEQQLEALKKWWKENGQATIIGVVTGVAAILAWDYWQNYKKGQFTQASAMYQQLLQTESTAQPESVIKSAEQLQQQFKGSEYALYSELFAADAKVKQNDLAGAKQILKDLLVKADDELAHIARIRLVRLMMASGEFEQGLQVVNEASAKAPESLAGSYDELVGDLYVALDRLDEARTSYESALRNKNQSPLLQIKLDDLGGAAEKAAAKK